MIKSYYQSIDQLNLLGLGSRHLCSKWLIFSSLYNIILSLSFRMSAHLTAFQKARKILSSYDEIQPRKYCVLPHNKSNEKQKRPSSYSSASKSSIKKDFSFCKSQKKEDDSLAGSKLSLKPRKQSNSSFVSTYAKETRLDKIMKLQIKPRYAQGKRIEKTKKSVINSSFSSVDSRKQNKENRGRKISRLQKIMQLKTNKPKVSSTLINYEPRQGSRSANKQKRESAVKQWKECQVKIKKRREQQEKEDRLWKVFERQRELRYKLKKDSEDRQYKENRRKEQRFQGMVVKELTKIQRDREISKRKSEGFSNYVYPGY